MSAIEFRATVTNGVIEIPEEYRGRVSGVVHVRMEPTADAVPASSMIQELLNRPLHWPGFRPLSREAAHAR